MHLSSQNLYPAQQEQSASPIEAQTIVDDQGYNRRFYQVGDDVQIIFRGREELPTLSTADSRPVSLLTPDEPPRQIAPNEFAEYVASKRTDVTDQPKLLIANATPVGVIDLALSLRKFGQSDDEQLSNLRSNLLQGRIGIEETNYLDSLAAAVFVDKTEATSPDRTDGLMDVALSLNGNLEAQDRINEKLITLAEQSQHLRVQELGAETVRLVLNHEPIDAEAIKKAQGLVLVRTTDNEPESTESGALKMMSAGHYTKDVHRSAGVSYIPRHTTHFTLNHHVESHLAGNFDNKGLTILAPLDKVLEVNGRPAVLNAVDTYFANGPDEGVVLPEAKVVRARSDQTELIIQVGNTTTYKSKNFTAEDYVKLADSMGALQSANNYGSSNNAELRDQITSLAFKSALLSHNRNGKVHYYEDNEEKSKIVLTQSDLEGLVPAEMIAAIAAQDPAAGEQYVANLLKAVAIDQEIQALGAKPVSSSGTSNYIITAGFDEKIQELQTELGVRGGLHSNEIEYQVEQAAFEKTLNHQNIVNGRYAWENVINPVGDAINQLLSDADTPQQLRRSMLQAGFLCVRDEKTKFANRFADSDDSDFLLV